MRVWAWRITWKKRIGLFFPFSVILSLVITQNEHGRTWEEQKLERDLVVQVKQDSVVP